MSLLNEDVQQILDSYVTEALYFNFLYAYIFWIVCHFLAINESMKICNLSIAVFPTVGCRELLNRTKSGRIVFSKCIFATLERKKHKSSMEVPKQVWEALI